MAPALARSCAASESANRGIFDIHAVKRGDRRATNIITPLMVYFPLILIFCQRWQKDFGLGSLAATMLPYSIGLLLAGLVMTIGWVALDLPLGPGASVFMDVPTTVAPTAPATPGVVR